jgi:hypothetical protein
VKLCFWIDTWKGMTLPIVYSDPNFLPKKSEGVRRYRIEAEIPDPEDDEMPVEAKVDRDDDTVILPPPGTKTEPAEEPLDLVFVGTPDPKPKRRNPPHVYEKSRFDDKCGVCGLPRNDENHIPDTVFHPAESRMEQYEVQCSVCGISALSVHEEGDLPKFCDRCGKPVNCRPM